MANKKVTELTAATKVVPEDLTHVVTDIAGTPINQKAGYGIFLSTYNRSTAEQAALLSNDDIDFAFDRDDPRRFFAVMNGVADDTAAFVTMQSVGLLTIKLFGTYAVGDLNVTASIDGQGIGKFVAISGATTVLNWIASTDDSWHYRRLKDFEIDAEGDAVRTVDAITLPNTAHLASSLIADGLYITAANRAIYKPNGSIGDEILTCTVKNNNYGYFATDTTGPIQHPGANRIRGGEWAGNRIAAIYIRSTQNSGGTILDEPKVENNVGFGVYFDGYNLAGTAPELRSKWLENNNTGNADIDLGFGNGLETPRDLFCRNVDHIRVKGSSVTAVGMEFVNSMALLDGCFFSPQSTLIKDSDSVVRAINANLNGIDGSADVVIESLTQQRLPSQNSGTTMLAQIPPRTHIVTSLPGSGVAVYSNSFAFADHTFSGTSSGGGVGVRTKSVNSEGPGIYDWYNNYTFTTDGAKTDDLIPILLNKWYVVTDAVRVVSGEIGTIDFKSASGTLNLMNNLDSPLRDNIPDGDWVHLGGVVEYTDDTGSGNIRYHAARTASTATTYGQGPVQVIQFDTQQEATDYYNSRAFYQAEAYEYNGLATTSSGSIAIDFTTEGFQDQPDQSYNISLTTDSTESATLHWSSKLVTGFTINMGIGTNTVHWRIYRRDL